MYIRNLCIAALLTVYSHSAAAGLPSNYEGVAFDEAIARADKDGRPLMVYFSEDW